MNAKKCKELRREIRKLPQVATAYEAKQPIPIGWGIKLEDGSIKPGSGVFDKKLMIEGEDYVPVAFKAGQTRMIRNSTRKVYQMAKRAITRAARFG